MTKPVFTVKVGESSYSIVLPQYETDYIQGMLAQKASPYEMEMLQTMRSLLNKGDLVVDVGANIGNHALYLAAVAGCRVLAFEPNPVLASPLQESIEINKLEDRISLVRKGLGAETTKAVFAEINPSNLGAQSLKVISETQTPDAFDTTMDIIALDSLTIDQTVKAIKIDVEGMELAVLEGAKRLIERDQPNLFIESHNVQEFDRIYGFLKQWGYIYWRTFNATPTNWFLPPKDIAKADLHGHGLDQGKTFYRLWQERMNLRQKVTELQNSLSTAPSKESDGETRSDDNAFFDHGQLAQLNRDYGSHETNAHPERALGLDFSLPEERHRVRH